MAAMYSFPFKRDEIVYSFPLPTRKNSPKKVLHYAHLPNIMDIEYACDNNGIVLTPEERKRIMSVLRAMGQVDIEYFVDDEE